MRNPKCCGAGVASLPQVLAFIMLVLTARNARCCVSSTGKISVEILMDIVSILSFRRVLYVVCFLLGISPASQV